MRSPGAACTTVERESYQLARPDGCETKNMRNILQQGFSAHSNCVIGCWRSSAQWKLVGSLQSRGGIHLLTALLLSSVAAIADVSVAELELRNPPQSDSDGLVVTWMGITTLIIADGGTNLITEA